MLHVLIYDILPVFAMLALGFAMGRSGTASGDEARALNRIAFLVLQPPLIFLLITGLDLPSFDVGALAVYAACQVAAFLTAFLLARRLFGRGLRESVLLGMAVIFVNSLLYIWPIAQLIYGEAGALPVTAIVAWDTVVTFSLFIITMELLDDDGDLRGAATRLSRNPVLLTILLALALNLSGLAIPEPVLTAARFAGAAAAPLTLFALGVILSAHPLRPAPVVVAIASLKLLLFPLLVLGALALLSPGNPWLKPFLLTAAGPSGAMAFALAMLYGVRTDAIAPVTIWTAFLSLISLAYLA